MNCRDAEKRIYLYRELSASEREETDAHVRACSACRRIMEGVTLARNIARTASPPPALPDPARMTAEILSALPQSQQKTSSAFMPFFSWSPGNRLRYGMATISLFLIFTFVSEYNQDSSFRRPTKRYHGAARRIELNTASFHQAFLATKEKNNNTAPLYECVVNCLQTQGTVCTDCGIKLSKPNHTP